VIVGKFRWSCWVGSLVLCVYVGRYVSGDGAPSDRDDKSQESNLDW